MLYYCFVLAGLELSKDRISNRKLGFRKYKYWEFFIYEKEDLVLSGIRQWEIECLLWKAEKKFYTVLLLLGCIPDAGR